MSIKKKAGRPALTDEELKEREQGATKIVCGLSKLRKGERYGTAEECGKLGQIRRYGKIEVDEELLNRLKIKEETLYNMREKILIDLVKIRGRIRFIKRELTGKLTDIEKKAFNDEIAELNVLLKTGSTKLKEVEAKISLLEDIDKTDDKPDDKPEKIEKPKRIKLTDREKKDKRNAKLKEARNKLKNNNNNNNNVINIDMIGRLNEINDIIKQDELNFNITMKEYNDIMKRNNELDNKIKSRKDKERLIREKEQILLKQEEMKQFINNMDKKWYNAVYSMMGNVNKYY